MTLENLRIKHRSAQLALIFAAIGGFARGQHAALCDEVAPRVSSSGRAGPTPVPGKCQSLDDFSYARYDSRSLRLSSTTVRVRRSQGQWETEQQGGGEGGYDYQVDFDYGPMRTAPNEEWGDWGEEIDEGWKGSQGRRLQQAAGGGRGGSGGGEGDGESEGFEPIHGDLVDEYTASLNGRILLSVSASVVGAGLGAVLSKATFQRTRLASLVGLLTGLILSVARGPFGNLFRALGLSLVLALKRGRLLGADYPLIPYLRCALALAPRRPFPLADNPWKYRPGEMEDGGRDVSFSMAKSLLAVGFLGAFGGYFVSQFTFLPSFLFALGFGGASAYIATTKNSRGDLARLVGMRAVAFLGLAAEINEDVYLTEKAKVVGGICFSKLMAWDNKYHIKDRLMAMATGLYATIMSLVGQVQRDIGDGGRGGEDLMDEDFQGSEDGTRGDRAGFGMGGRQWSQPPTPGRTGEGHGNYY